jgi:hypothetical protein
MSGREDRDHVTMESWLTSWLLPDADLREPEAGVAPVPAVLPGGAR